jgi:hypothetical protein
MRQETAWDSRLHKTFASRKASFSLLRHRQPSGPQYVRLEPGAQSERATPGCGCDW